MRAAWQGAYYLDNRTGSIWDRTTMAGTRKRVPEFRSEEEERNFWADHDSTEFIDWQAGQKRRFPNLKPSLRTVSPRLDKERRRE